MAKIELNTTIAAPIEKVWAFATNYKNWPDFVANLQSIDLKEGDELREGSVVEMNYKLVGDRTVKMSQTIDTIDADKGLFLGTITEGFPGTNRWTYESVDDGKATKVSVLMEYSVPGSVLGAIADKLIIEKYNTKSMETSLANLKAKVS